jgi:hypothetical protein
MIEGPPNVRAKADGTDECLKHYPFHGRVVFVPHTACMIKCSIVRSWHESDLPQSPLFGRYQRKADIEQAALGKLDL